MMFGVDGRFHSCAAFTPLTARKIWPTQTFTPAVQVAEPLRSTANEISAEVPAL